eukprot:GHVU01012918.1.p1 GENE.GHVU01012918.1~~GHVU01012918.1.p1  ORF type:complete len:247 (+),score=10.54 GHVU01012918.1:93-833(+)
MSVVQRRPARSATKLLPLLAAFFLALAPSVCYASVKAKASSRGAGGAVRGIHPDNVTSYTSAFKKGSFTCLKSKEAIPASAVNDDYCDCADASDEPGTSACAEGRMWCRNNGHEPHWLAAMYVDDGICDCCDGSDEPAGHVKCHNTCRGAATEAKKIEARNKVMAHTTKAAIQKAAQNHGKQKHQLQSRIGVLKQRIATRNAELSKIQGMHGCTYARGMGTYPCMCVVCTYGCTHANMCGHGCVYA